jgi:hypothetical protein
MLASLVPLALSACDRENEPIAAEANEANAIALDLPANGNRVEIQRWLARLRHATSGFHDFERATTAGGYSVQITQCMTQPPDGGMGLSLRQPRTDRWPGRATGARSPALRAATQWGNAGW